MRHVVTLTIIGLGSLLLGCGPPRALLGNPGAAYLTGRGRAIEITGKDPLELSWSENGVSYRTRAMVDGRRKSAFVRLVEANQDFVRVRSDAWKEPGDIPASYRKLTEARVVPGGPGYKKPTLMIPLGRIEEVGIYGQVPRRERTSTGDIVKGALGAATAIMVMVASEVEPEPDQGAGVLTVALVAAGVGAVAYPAYRVLAPQREPEPDVYPIGGPAGYRLEIRPPLPR